MKIRGGSRWIPAMLLALTLGSHTLAQVSAQRSETDSRRPTPAHTGWINDEAGILSTADRAGLSKKLDRFHRDTFHQIAVLTVPGLRGESIESLSLRVANAWALGYKGIDNGILITVAPMERKVRIEVGKGLEPYVDDKLAQAIITESMGPAFAQGHFAPGLDKGLERLMAAAAAYVVHDPAHSPARN